MHQRKTSFSLKRQLRGHFGCHNIVIGTGRAAATAVKKQLLLYENEGLSSLMFDRTLSLFCQNFRFKVMTKHF